MGVFEKQKEVAKELCISQQKVNFSKIGRLVGVSSQTIKNWYDKERWEEERKVFSSIDNASFVTQFSILRFYRHQIGTIIKSYSGQDEDGNELIISSSHADTLSKLTKQMQTFQDANTFIKNKDVIDRFLVHLHKSKAIEIANQLEPFIDSYLRATFELEHK